MIPADELLKSEDRPKEAAPRDLNAATRPGASSVTSVGLDPIEVAIADI